MTASAPAGLIADLIARENYDRAVGLLIALRHPGVLTVMREFHDQRAGSTVEHMIRGLDSA